MKLSLIVAIYNLEDYVEDCIKSIVKQDLTDCEVLLIDDGSKDKSAEICKKYTNENIKYLCKTNGGVGSARNYGIKQAKGDYIWLIDGDDEIIHNSIEILLKTLKTFNSELIMFYPLHKRLNEEKLRLEAEMQHLKDYTVLDFLTTIKSFPVTIWAFLIKKDFLIKNNLFFDENITQEDNHFMYQVFNKAKKVSAIDKSLYIYKAREGSQMKSEISDKKIKSKFKIIELLHNMPPENLSEIIIKTKLFFYLREFILLNKTFNDVNTKKMFKDIPKQKIFLKDKRGVIIEKILYNYFKKIYRKKLHAE